MQHAIECSLKAFLCRRSSSGVYVRETPQMEESTTVFAPVVSQEACEQFLLNSTAFVAYSFYEDGRTCELLSDISEMVSSSFFQSGAAVKEFPWLCNLHCQDEPRWTNGIILVSRYHTGGCQCCINDWDVLPRTGQQHYLCSSEACQVCDGTGTSSAVRAAKLGIVWSWRLSLPWLALATASVLADLF
ncbi:unnamed protein product [Symbiodinium natans]|uniref:Uncharacterized protein n=1 Tax=Symbiodinium natans TaxID=878477 RepID=A0A812QL59_9DINO|nr:unnamed protein product [Symbiodinium natans]